MKTEILSDYNEFESINREAEAIIGSTSGKYNQKMEGMRSMAESVLRMKLTPKNNREVSDMTRRISEAHSVGENSPIEVLVHSGRLQKSNQLRHSTRHHPLTSRLEQIEEELKSIHGGNGKHARNNPAGIRTALVEEVKNNRVGNINDYAEDDDSSSESSSQNSDKRENSDK